MGSGFFEYLQRLELLAFFSGYPLVYTVGFFIACVKPKNKFVQCLISNLPFGYGIVGILYIGLQLKDLYPDYSFQNIKATELQSWLNVWGALSIFFLIPVVAEKRIFSLLHSLVFFFVLMRDFFSQVTFDIVSNDMKVYTVSILLNAAAVLFMSLLVCFVAGNKQHFLS